MGIHSMSQLRKTNARCFGLQGLLRAQNSDLVHCRVEMIMVTQQLSFDQCAAKTSILCVGSQPTWKSYASVSDLTWCNVGETSGALKSVK